MAYFCATIYMKDRELSKSVLPRHVKYLDNLESEGKVLGRGPFEDGSGGLIIYNAKSLKEATELAENDPHVKEGVSRLELRQWNVRRINV